MATVIGKSKKVKPKEADCHNCGSLVAYMKCDIQEYHGKDYSGEPDGRKWIVCPGCGEDITLESW